MVSAGFGQTLFEYFSKTPDVRFSPTPLPSCWSLGENSPVELSSYPDKLVPVSLAGDFVLQGLYQGVPFPNYYEDLMVFLTLADGSKGYRFRTSPSDTDTPHTALTRQPIALPSAWSCYGGAHCLENSIRTLYASGQVVPFSLSRVGNTMTWMVAGQNHSVVLNASFLGVPLSLNIASWNDRGKNFVTNVTLSSSQCTVSQPVVTCTDSDVNATYPDGKNYGQKGTFVLTGLPPFYDSCSASYNGGNSEPVTSCSGTTCDVVEYYCTADNAINSKYQPCSQGCSNGACNAAPVVVCASDVFTCSDGSTRTRNASTSCQFDACPSSGLTCTDSDDGINYGVKGDVISLDYGQTDDCLKDRSKLSPGDFYFDYLAERTCSVPGDILSQTGVLGYGSHSINGPFDVTYRCSNGCFDGACAYGSGELITLTSSNDRARVTINGDAMIVRVVTATDSLARIELGEVDEVETASVELAVGTSTVIAGATIFLSDADADLGGFSVQFTVSAQVVCSELIEGVQHPDESFVGDDGASYELNYNGTWVTEEYTYYQSGWSSPSLVGDEATYLSMHVRVFSDPSYVAGTRHPLYEKGCSVRDIEGNRVWVCSFEDSESTRISGDSGRKYSQLYFVWANRNVEVIAALETARTLSPEEVEKRVHDVLLAFNTQLQDNQFISSQGGDDLFHKRGAPLLSDFLAECPSTIVATVDYSSLACKLEPVICPPHGYQTKICLRDGQEVSSSTYSCNPGICSGCMVPRWLGARGGDNVCLPYGTRLLTAVVDRETLRFQDLNEEEEFSVVFTDEYSGTITLNEDISNDLSYLAVNGEQISLVKGTTFRFEEGMTYAIDLADGYEDANHYTYVLTVEDIVKGSSDADSFLRLSFGGEKQPMYCNYDGSLNVQKVKDYDGNWAQCQNNYECESNVCSSEECIEVTDLIQQGKGLKGFVISLLCRLTNVFSADGYNQCIAEAYGQ